MRFLYNANPQGMYIGATFFALFGIMYASKARKTPKDAVAVPIQAMPAQIQRPYFKRLLWVCIILFPILTGIIAFILYPLKTGAVQSAMVPEPFAMLYENFGFWPTVLSIPALQIFCCAVCVYRLRKCESETPHNAN